MTAIDTFDRALALVSMMDLDRAFSILLKTGADPYTALMAMRAACALLTDNCAEI
jgi:hypothetical protein